MRKVLVAGLSALLLAVGAAGASAHTHMTASVPKDGSTVAAGLAEVELDFTKPMRLTVVKVTNVKDKREVALKGELPKAFAKAAKVSVEPLVPGGYDVSWTAVADDGHVMNGSFKFTVGEGKDEKPKQ